MFHKNTKLSSAIISMPMTTLQDKISLRMPTYCTTSFTTTKIIPSPYADLKCSYCGLSSFHISLCSMDQYISNLLSWISFTFLQEKCKCIPSNILTPSRNSIVTCFQLLYSLYYSFSSLFFSIILLHWLGFPTCCRNVCVALSSLFFLNRIHLSNEEKEQKLPQNYWRLW